MATAKYEVKQAVLIELTAVIIVDADSKEDAVEKAQELFAGSSYEAIDTKSMGWKASVTLKPPPDHLAALKRTDIKAEYVQGIGGPGPARAKKQKD